MCINIALPAEVRVNNQGQKLAGTGIFVSRSKGGARYDDPVALNICRLHFEERHNGSWGEIPHRFLVARPEGRNPFIQPGDEDVTAFRTAIMEDSPIGRGYWKTCPWEMYHLPHENHENWEGVKYCTKGEWAYVVNPSPYLPDADAVFIERDKPATLGGWYQDGYYGCYLSYAIPVGGPIKIIEEERDHPFPALKVEIPRGTKYALWLRCSDSGVHSGFIVIKLEWWDLRDGRGTNLYRKPVLASLFGAPHAFPARKLWDGYEVCEVPNFGQDIHAAVKLAEYLAKHDGFKSEKGGLK